MNKSDLVEQIIKRQQEMLPLLRRSHIKRIDYPIKYILQYNDEELLNLHAWIESIYYNEYYELYKIFKMTEDDNVWDRYLKFGIEGLPEQLLFAEAGEKLKEKWYDYKHPRPFKATKPETIEKSADGVSI